MSDTKKVALVLGSGGARGLAHIGVIHALLDRGYTISAISGASIGALIGGIYAMGKLDEYSQWVSQLSQRDVLALVDWSFSGGGLIRGTTLMHKLQELFGECNIEDMKIPFTAVAVDIEQGKEVWLDKGPLFDAVRASIAVPGIFTPHQYARRRLVDGGLLNPVPVAPTLRSGSDITIAVDLNGGFNSEHETATENPDSSSEDANWWDRLAAWASPDQSKLAATSQVMIDALDIMQGQLTRLSLSVYSPDLLIKIPRNSAGMHEFHRARHLIELGKKMALRKLDELDVAS